MEPVASRLEYTAGLFRAKANRNAVAGALFAFATVVLATLLVCLTANQEIGLTSILTAQRTNPALWLLDLMPLVFAVWGQHTGTVLSYQASAMVMDETAALRERSDALAYQLEHSQAENPWLGLPNRRALRAALSEVLARTGESARLPATLMVEIDQLRDVNRILGEATAEDLMRMVAQRLRSITSREQVLAYLGHNEFGMLCSSITSVDDLQQLAQRIQRALDTPVAMAGMQISLQARIGAALADGDPTTDAETLLRRAEIAKYAARTDLNDYVLYQPALETTRAGRLGLAAELHSSLSHDGLSLSYLPLLDRQDGSFNRLRACPRWPHPRRGMIEERDFLHLAERGGLLHGLSLWLLRQGMNALESARRQHGAKIVLSVRLPDAALNRLPVHEMVARLLAAHDLPNDALVLEFSEASLRATSSGSAAQLEALRRRGVGICLEGFGGPQCGLSTLVDYPLGEVMLSGSLVKRVPDDVRATTVLQSTIALARQLGLRCSATGVSSRAQREALQEHCDWLAGPAIQDLVPHENLGEWLANREIRVAEAR